MELALKGISDMNRNERQNHHDDAHAEGGNEASRDVIDAGDGDRPQAPDRTGADTRVREDLREIALAEDFAYDERRGHRHERVLRTEEERRRVQKYDIVPRLDEPEKTAGHHNQLDVDGETHANLVVKPADEELLHYVAEHNRGQKRGSHHGVEADRHRVSGQLRVEAAEIRDKPREQEHAHERNSLQRLSQRHAQKLVLLRDALSLLALELFRPTVGLLADVFRMQLEDEQRPREDEHGDNDRDDNVRLAPTERLDERRERGREQRAADAGKRHGDAESEPAMLLEPVVDEDWRGNDEDEAAGKAEHDARDPLLPRLRIKSHSSHRGDDQDEGNR